MPSTAPTTYPRYTSPFPEICQICTAAFFKRFRPPQPVAYPEREWRLAAGVDGGVSSRNTAMAYATQRLTQADVNRIIKAVDADRAAGHSVKAGRVRQQSPRAAGPAGGRWRCGGRLSSVIILRPLAAGSSAEPPASRRPVLPRTPQQSEEEQSCDKERLKHRSGVMFGNNPPRHTDVWPRLPVKKWRSRVVGSLRMERGEHPFGEGWLRSVGLLGCSAGLRRAQ